MDWQAAAGVGTALAAILTALKADKLLDAFGRWQAKRRDKQISADEIRKTTRVLLETIELKNEEMAMKDRMLANYRTEDEHKQDIIMQQRETIARLMGRDGAQP